MLVTVKFKNGDVYHHNKIEYIEHNKKRDLLILWCRGSSCDCIEYPLNKVLSLKANVKDNLYA